MSAVEGCADPLERGPAVTVVVPVFGTEAYLNDCLSSVMCQSFRSFEVVVVDDASPGGVDAIVAGITGLAGRVKVLKHKVNQGALAARLTGAAAAAGKYFAFIDSDDVVDPRFLELLYSAARRHDADLVQCAMILVETDGSIACWHPGGASPEIEAGSPLAEFMRGRLANSLCNKLFRARCWHRATTSMGHLARRVDFGEDMLFLFHLLRYCKSCVQIGEPLYRYLGRAGSVTTKEGLAANAQRLADLSQIYETIRPWLAESGEPDELKKKFVHREFSMMAKDLLDKDPAIGRAHGPLPFPLPPGPGR